MKYHNVLVVGMAKSGISAAILLKKLGSSVTVQDIKEREKLGEGPSILEALGIELYLGKNPDQILTRFDLVVTSPGVPTDLPFFEKLKGLSIPVWSEIELAYSLCKCPCVAVTGTNGKTTTVSLLLDIIKGYCPSAQLVGNIGVPFTEKVLDMGEESLVIAEISSFQLEYIHTFKPRVSAVLNITPDHLNRHKTLAQYIAAKKEIFKNQDERDFLVLNHEDPVCYAMKDEARCPVVFFSGAGPLAEGVFVWEKAIYARWNGYNEKVIDIAELQLLGAHNWENAAAAIAVCLCAGVPMEAIRGGLRRFKAVAHRIEYVTEINGVAFYNDSKGTNPDASVKSIQAIDRPLILIAGGYNKGSDFSGWIKAFAGKVKYMVVLGEVADSLAETAKRYDFRAVEKANTLKDAVTIAYSKAAPGDAVLLSPACASWDMFDSYEQRGDLFKAFVFELDLPNGR